MNLTEEEIREFIKTITKKEMQLIRLEMGDAFFEKHLIEFGKKQGLKGKKLKEYKKLIMRASQ